jgi:cytochrome c biogenesis protein CcmG/thiol:disulfide interchange protein DsbE
MSIRSLLPLGIFAALLVVLGIGLTLKPQDLPSEFINKPVPEFRLESLIPGEPPVSSEDLKGEFVLLNVFGSWCVACLVEHPHLVDLQSKGAIRIVGLDWRDTREDALAWLNRHGNPYDQIGFDQHSEVAISLGVTGAPETFLIDPSGQIRYKQIGPITPEVWQKTLLPMIRHIQSGGDTE